MPEKTEGKSKIATVQYKIDAREFKSLDDAFSHIKLKIKNDANYYGGEAEVRTIIVWYSIYKKTDTEES